MAHDFDYYWDREKEVAYANIARHLEAKAKAEHRYENKSGKLTAAIYSDSDVTGEIALAVKQSVEYGTYVLEGHGTWAPDPFLQDALDNSDQYVEDELSKAMDRAWNAYART